MLSLLPLYEVDPIGVLLGTPGALPVTADVYLTIYGILKTSNFGIRIVQKGLYVVDSDAFE